MAVVREVIGLVAVTAFLVACSSDEGRGPRPIVGWSVDAGVLHLWIDTCDGDPETDVVETADDVTVTVVSTRRDPGDACQDPVTVTLTAPLGDRSLIDGSTGQEPEPMEG
jgi:hypothetical protein